jgi:hypothetical protein
MKQAVYKRTATRYGRIETKAGGHTGTANNSEG